MLGLAEVLERAGRGDPPPGDGIVDLAPAPVGARAAVLAFSGHLVVAADLDRSAMSRHFPAGDYRAWCDPAGVAWLAAQVGGRLGIVDALLVSDGIGEEDGFVAEAGDSLSSHPRVVDASAHRRSVRVFTTASGTGVLVLGHGLTGRRELAFEVEASHRCQGVGRRLATAARRRTPAGSLIWAQVAPANAASIRALLAAGFKLIGTEQLIR